VESTTNCSVSSTFRTTASVWATCWSAVRWNFNWSTSRLELARWLNGGAPADARSLLVVAYDTVVPPPLRTELLVEAARTELDRFLASRPQLARALDANVRFGERVNPVRARPPSYPREAQMKEVEGNMIRHILDGEDLYNITMGWIAAKRYPNVLVRYRYQNRDPDVVFPYNFIGALRGECENLRSISHLWKHEVEYLEANVPGIPRTHWEWLGKGNWNDDDVVVTASTTDNKLNIEIAGPWYKAIYWEVRLLAMISGLMAKELPKGWEQHIRDKAERLSAAGVQWVDFGTRRRHSGSGG
jgi:hypothetical protein